MVVPTLSALSLCSGIGGLDLGVRIGSGVVGYRARTVCYVEREAFAAAVLVARMDDEALDAAPVYSDLLTFDPLPWRGCVDLVHAGFPCQPVSLAGKRLGQDDARWLWPRIADIIGVLRPRYVFLENVPGLISRGLGDVLADLSTLGFDAEWLTLRASDVGAPHKRERWFCLAYRVAGAGDRLVPITGRGPEARAGTRSAGAVVADAIGHGPQGEFPGGTAAGSVERGGRAELADAEGGRVRRGRETGKERLAPLGSEGVADASCITEREPADQADTVSGGGEARVEPLDGGRVFPPGRDPELWRDITRDRWPTTPDTETEPAVRGVADGTPEWMDPSLYSYRADRLRALGNGVVPQQAASAFVELWRRIHE
jgi:DNA (cytosine-5)-methyltransferase 1